MKLLSNRMGLPGKGIDTLLLHPLSPPSGKDLRDAIPGQSDMIIYYIFFLFSTNTQPQDQTP
jgi:hypothetical protein